MPFERLALACLFATLAVPTPAAQAREVVQGFEALRTGPIGADAVDGVHFLDPVEVFRAAHTPAVIRIPGPLDPTPAGPRPQHALRHAQECSGDACANGAWRVRFEFGQPARSVA